MYRIGRGTGGKGGGDRGRLIESMIGLGILLSPPIFPPYPRLPTLKACLINLNREFYKILDV